VSEEKQVQQDASSTVKLNGLFAFKMGMSSIFNEQGDMIPVTVLKFDNWFVSQVKTEDKDGYQAIQIASGPKKSKNGNKAEKTHLKAAGFENGAKFVKEIRQALPEGISVGQRVAIDSFSVGDTVRLSSTSKGHGFTGAVKRHNFAGGPATHGSGFHRRPGSAGNRTWPGRIMPGKRGAGHYGDETVTIKNVQIVGVFPEENAILVKGPVPGAKNTLVRMVKEA
jgi:large subunit ribosomal protein L3